MHPGSGYPFYIPEPDENLPPQYRSEGIRIGDVGVINAGGGFDFLFNITRPADDPINLNRVPSGFTPVTVNDQDVSRTCNVYSPGVFVGNSSFRKQSITAGASSEATPYVCHCITILTLIQFNSDNSPLVSAPPSLSLRPRKKAVFCTSQQVPIGRIF
jgi:hypothetical protein